MYKLPVLVDKQMALLNEKDLHYKVVDYIRKNNEDAIIIAGLGENQDTAEKRIYSKKCGYTSGQPDLLITNLHKHYTGFAIELKTPKGNGTTSDSQQQFLNNLNLNGYKVKVTNDYDDIITEIIKYMQDTRIRCRYCNRLFKNKFSLANHCRGSHRI